MKNPPADAGGTASIPGLGRPHRPRSSEARALQVLSPRTLEPVLCNKEATPARSTDSTAREQPMLSNEAQCGKKLIIFLKEKLFPVLPSVPRMRQWGQMTSTHVARWERSPLLGEPIRDGQKALYLCACAACLVRSCALCRHSGKNNQTRRQLSLCWKVVQMQQANEGWFADERKEGRTGGLLPQVSSLSSGESRTLLTWGLGGAAGEEIRVQFAVWGPMEPAGQRHRRLCGASVSARGRGCRASTAVGPAPPGPRAHSCRPPGCTLPGVFHSVAILMVGV